MRRRLAPGELHCRQAGQRAVIMNQPSEHVPNAPAAFDDVLPPQG